MNITALVGDAFAEQDNHNKYGHHIGSLKSEYTVDASIDFPSTQQLIVANAERRPIPSECHNLISTGDNCVAYIVQIASRNIARYIYTLTGAMTLFRGHQTMILDLKISPVNNRIVCSSSEKQVLIYTLDYVEESEQLSVIAQKSFEQGATIIRFSPVHGKVIILVKDMIITLINGENNTNSWESSSIVMPAMIKDAAFGTNGKYVVVGSEDGVSVCDVDNDRIISLRNILVNQSFYADQNLVLQSLVVTHHTLLTVSRPSESGDGYVLHTHAWFLDPKTPFTQLSIEPQSIKFSGPSKALTLVDNADPVWNYRITSLSKASNDLVPNYVFISHATNSYVICLYLPPRMVSYPARPVQEFCYVKLDKSPLDLSVNVKTSHNDLSINMAVFQESDRNIEVRMYETLAASLRASKLNEPIFSNEENESHSQDLGYLNNFSQSSRSLFPGLFNSSSHSSSKSSLLDSASKSQEIDASSSLIASPETKASVISSTSVSKEADNNNEYNMINNANSEVKIETSVSTKISLLSVLGINKPVSATDSNAKILANDTKPTAIGLESYPVASNVAPVVENPSFSTQKEVKSATSQLMSLLSKAKSINVEPLKSKENDDTEDTEESSSENDADRSSSSDIDSDEESFDSPISKPSIPAVASPLPDFLISPSKESGKSIMDMIKSKQSTTMETDIKTPIKENGSNKTAKAKAVEDTKSLNQTTPAGLSTPNGKGATVLAALGLPPRDKSSESDKSPQSKVISPLASLASAATGIAADIGIGVGIDKKSNVSPLNFRGSILNADTKGTANGKTSTLAKEDIVASESGKKKAVIPPVASNDATLSQRVNKSTKLKSVLNANSISSNDEKLEDSKNSMQPESVLTAESLQLILSSPNMTQILRDIVKETIKESVKETAKDTLKTTMRSTFKESVIPAMESGISAMFLQVNRALEESLKSFVVAANNAGNSADLGHGKDQSEQVQVFQKSMDKLTATLSSLESNISQVSSSLSEIKERLNRLETRPPSFGLETAAYPWANVRVDPQTLISQGRISEALEAVVNATDITTLIDILSKVSSSQLLGQCSKAVQLCVVHRLTEDIVAQDPVEGWLKRMEWIKGLVMALISTMPLPTANAFSTPSPRQSIPTPSQSSPWINQNRSVSQGYGVNATGFSIDADAVADYHIRPALQQLHQFLGQTLNRLMEAVTSTKGSLTLNNPNPATSMDGALMRERMMTLSSSTLVADIQLLMTAIQSRCSVV